VVEVLGWDEAFLGAEADDPEALAISVREAVARETGLSCAVGIGDNKLRAKLATGFGKPGGIFRLTQENWWDVMAARPTDALWGIGGKTAKKLSEMAITSVLDLAGADPAELAARFGPKTGLRLLGGGISDADVSATPYVARSRSRETTFQHDLTDPAEMAAEVSALAKRVTQDVLEEGRPAARVAVKVRFVPFMTHTHSVTLPEPTSDAAEIDRAAREVLGMFELTRAVRLLGVRAEFLREG
jgi:DNA polymerase-4